MEAIVLLSGGQDSTTCAWWARETFGPGLRTLAFDYGQKHSIELELAARTSEKIGALSHEVLPLHALKQIGGAALTDDLVRVEEKASQQALDGHANLHAAKRGLPSTFVPGRNMLFFTLAAAYGARFGVYTLITGVCQADRAGYPDCRSEFVAVASSALTLALDEQVTIVAPLLTQSKSATWAMANKLGVLEEIVNWTHTCYNGVHDDDHLHEWGYGCGECPACNERANGYRQFKTGAFDAVTS